MIAERWGLGRTQLDEFSLGSHEQAAKAQADGAFDEEIAAVPTPEGLVRADEGVCPGGTLEKLASLKTPFKEDGVISAGNASQISDGSAALLVTSSEVLARSGLGIVRGRRHGQRHGPRAARLTPGDGRRIRRSPARTGRTSRLLHSWVHSWGQTHTGVVTTVARSSHPPHPQRFPRSAV